MADIDMLEARIEALEDQVARLTDALHNARFWLRRDAHYRMEVARQYQGEVPS